MKLEEVKAALAPFARFAELFTHNVLGVNHDNFFSKDIAVNGEFKEFKLTGADFDRAKSAFDFLNGLDPSKRPEAPPAPKEGEEVVKLDGTQPEAPNGDQKSIPETKQEPMTGTAPAPGETTKEVHAPDVVKTEGAENTSKKGKSK